MGRACAKQSAWVHRIVSAISAIGGWMCHGAVARLASRSHNVRNRQFTAASAPHWRPVPVRVKYRAFRDRVGAEGAPTAPPRWTVMDEQRVPDLRQTPSRHQMDAARREARAPGGATILAA